MSNLVKKITFLLILSISYNFNLKAQFSFDSISSKSSLLKKVFDNPSKYHLQIIYTQIIYKDNKPIFKNYTLNNSLKKYFYCASLVKLPTSILALQKLNEIKVKQNSIFLLIVLIIVIKKTCMIKVLKMVTQVLNIILKKCF